MPHRIYRDAQGREWSVWDIHPEEVERQLRSDAAHPTTAAAAALAARQRMAVSPDLVGGWLCFERDDVKRRLTPIPTGWQHLSDEELERLCEQALAAPAPRRRHRHPPAAPGDAASL